MSSISEITAQAAKRQRVRTFPRLIASQLYSQAQKTFLADAAQKLFPEDQKLKSLIGIIEQRAATTPYTTTSDSGVLVNTLISDVIDILSPMVGSAHIVRDSLKVPGVSRIRPTTIPLVNTSSSAIGPVGEAAAIPVAQLQIDESNALILFKNALILAATRELIEHSTPAFVALVTAVTLENFGLWLDVAMFGNAAGSTLKSAGLLNGLSSLTKSVKSDPLAAMMEDVQTVAGAVSAVAGGGGIILIAGPKTSIKLQQWQDRVGPFPVYGSAAVAEGTLIAIAPRGIATAIDDVPEIAVSKDATLLMSDSPSGPTLSTVGTPNTIQAPARSMLQTDSIACRFIFGASWLRRSDSAVAYISGVTAW